MQLLNALLIGNDVMKAKLFNFTFFVECILIKCFDFFNNSKKYLKKDKIVIVFFLMICLKLITANKLN